MAQLFRGLVLSSNKADKHLDRGQDCVARHLLAFLKVVATLTIHHVLEESVQHPSEILVTVKVEVRLGLKGPEDVGDEYTKGALRLLRFGALGIRWPPRHYAIPK